MLSKKSLEEVVDKVVKVLPESLQRGSAGLHQRIEEALAGAVRRLDLVTREEFDAQTAVLKRCQEELKRLNDRLNS